MAIKPNYTLTFLVALLLLLPIQTASLAAQSHIGIHTFAPTSLLAQGQWVKVAIPQTGVYQITYAELRRMGFSDPAKVGVYGFGGNIIDENFSNASIDDLPELAVYHDSAGGRVLFHALGVVKWNYEGSSRGFVHTNNPYATQACYFLHQKEGEPRKMEQIPAAEQYDLIQESFDDYALHEKDQTNIGSTGREMYGESFLYTRTQDFRFHLPKTINGNAKITVNFIANANSSTQLTGSINGTQFINASISSIGSNSYQRARAVNAISDWNPTQGADYTVRVTYNPSSTSVKLAMLNFIRLNMERELTPLDVYTPFRNARAATNSICYSIQAFDRQRYQVWDITDPVNHFVQEVKSYNNVENGFVSPYEGIREYAILSINDRFPNVTVVGNVTNQNLHALPQTDMVIIVQPKLREEAERLAQYRRTNDNLHVTVVSPEQIYNEFSSGTPDATAYRLFMKMFYDRSAAIGTPPRYLLLFGDGAYDNRAMNSLWRPTIIENNLLTYQSESSLNETESYVCDDYFGFLDDTEGGKLDSYGQISLAREVLDIGIGRFPVQTVAQAKAVVDKVINYSNNKETGGWKNQLCFLGDDGDNNIHMRHADSLVNIIKRSGHKEYLFNKIYLDAYKRETTSSGTAYPDPHRLFKEQLTRGNLLVNYSGHGATNSITHESLFTLADAETIQMKRLPVWVTATCDFGRFDDLQMSAGEALLLNPNGGSIAMFTTTRVVYTSGNLAINVRLIQNMFNYQSDGTRYRLGDIIKKAKVALGNEVNKLNFMLLGDPSMAMAYPEHRMELTEIDGTPLDGTELQIKAMSRVTMKGHVLEIGSNQTATGFNGIIESSVFDAEERITALDNDNTGAPFTFLDRNKRIFSGRDSVRNGEFEFSFIVPKDISYSMLSGMVNLYAVDANQNEAQGYFENFVLGGSAEDVEEDTTPPVINQLYMNSSNFKDGDAVNSTPYLYAMVEDESGINTSGNGIGHDLVITIKGAGATRRYVLNDYYYPVIGEANKGSVQFSIPELPEGIYELEMKVWDVFNNSTSRTISFVVKKGEKPILYDLQVNRNPARESVQFLLFHDRPETNIKVRIQVYTQMGQSVWDHQQTGSAEFMKSMPITWDLSNGAGARVLPGIYIYRASISENGEHYVTKSKKLIILGK